MFIYDMPNGFVTKCHDFGKTFQTELNSVEINDGDIENFPKSSFLEKLAKLNTNKDPHFFKLPKKYVLSF